MLAAAHRNGKFGFYRYRESSREKNPKNYQNFLLTPTNRKQNLAYLHQSRDSSRGLSPFAKRDYGAGIGSSKNSQYDY